VRLCVSFMCSLSGYHPFDVYGELAEPQLLKKILACQYDFDDEVWTHISQEAKNLIRGLLKSNPNDRMSIDDFLSSPWMRGEGVKDKELPLIINRLDKFNQGRRRFRALVFAKLASKKFKKSIDRSRNNIDASPNISSRNISKSGYGSFIDSSLKKDKTVDQKLKNSLNIAATEDGKIHNLLTPPASSHVSWEREQLSFRSRDRDKEKNKDKDKSKSKNKVKEKDYTELISDPNCVTSEQ